MQANNEHKNDRTIERDYETTDTLQKFSDALILSIVDSTKTERIFLSNNKGILCELASNTKGLARYDFVDWGDYVIFLLRYGSNPWQLQLIKKDDCSIKLAGYLIDYDRQNEIIIYSENDIPKKNDSFTVYRASNHKMRKYPFPIEIFDNADVLKRMRLKSVNGNNFILEYEAKENNLIEKNIILLLMRPVISLSFIIWGIYACSNKTNSFQHETYASKHDTLLHYKNITIYAFKDLDSFTNIVGFDNEGSFIDTQSLKHGTNYPDILLRDINGDGNNDIIVSFDFSDAATVIRYWVYCSAKNQKLGKPEVNISGKTTDFFNVKDFVNTNMRILNNDTLMFQHSYSEVGIYQIRQLQILPLANIQRDSNFSSYAIWDKSKNGWDNHYKIGSKNYWVELALKNWDKPFVGEH